MLHCRPCVSASRDAYHALTWCAFFFVPPPLVTQLLNAAANELLTDKQARWGADAMPAGGADAAGAVVASTPAASSSVLCGTCAVPCCWLHRCRNPHALPALPLMRCSAQLVLELAREHGLIEEYTEELKVLPPSPRPAAVPPPSQHAAGCPARLATLVLSPPPRLFVTAAHQPLPGRLRTPWGAALRAAGQCRGVVG